MEQQWDVIIIGTGMGGSVLGFELAKSGRRVLFLERGEISHRAPDAVRGVFPDPIADTDGLKKSGRFTDTVIDVSGKKPEEFVPFIGSGSGGSTALYGSILERFRPEDFQPLRHFFSRNANLANWPIAYSDLEPYYKAAEKLFDVSPSRSLSAPSQELTRFFNNKGFHAYRLPLAVTHAKNCGGCQGFLCAENCKRDSATVCLFPAVERYGATLLDRCEVRQLETVESSVTGVVGVRNGVQVRFEAPMVVLAAGALETPLLLLKSKNTRHPRGLANSSDQVGRNLMRHFIDLYAVSLVNAQKDGRKEIGIPDFYLHPDGKFGVLQSFGAFPPISVIATELAKKIKKRFRLMPLTVFLPLIKIALTLLLKNKTVLASVLEDLPYVQNRVFPAPAGSNARFVFSYRIRSDEMDRIKRFRKLLRRALSPIPFVRLSQARSNERLAHACGTCRFGLDPRTSVLDKNNKAHDLDNLYVVDASFFPSSGGTNPSLTIAANALRVADHLLGRTLTKEKSKEGASL